jgi:Domain of unknown function (DUF4190)/Septum formation
VGLRFNPPPGWPPAPEGFVPQPDWRPDPSWPPPPPGWRLWVDDQPAPAQPEAPWAAQPGTPTGPRHAAGPTPPRYDTADSSAGPTAAFKPLASPGRHYTPADQPSAGNAGVPYTPAGQQASGGPGMPYSAGQSAFGGPGMPYTAPGQSAPGAGMPYSAAGQPSADGGGTPFAPFGMPSASGPGVPYATAGRSSASGKTSGWAISSFILGLLGVFVLGAIFGVVALRRINRLGQRGRGLAIAGLVLSALWLVIIVVVIAVSNIGNATRSPATGAITHGGSLSVFSLAVGDCFNNPPGATSLTSVTAIPCTQAHNAQIYAKFNLSGSMVSYPGDTTLTRDATNGCNARIGNLDKSKITDSMTIRFLFPQEDSWIAGQRTVTCMVANSAENLTSSVLKS